METVINSESMKSNAGSNSAAWSNRHHVIDTKDLTLEEVSYLFNLAKKYKTEMTSGVPPQPVLKGKVLANVFYETSTRTRSSFELAGIHLGMHVLNLEVAASSVQKGESLEDTGRTLQALGVNAIVQRHSLTGSCERLVKVLSDKMRIINAGEGSSAHPTQGLLDAFTMLEHIESLKGAKVAIIGDITHSRVARSNLWLLAKLGVEVHVAGPATLLPEDMSEFGAHVHHRLEDALDKADFVMALRLQLERQKSGLITSLDDYANQYRLDHTRLKLAKPGVKVLHPGPLNRGVEITEALADDPTISLIEQQVANGVFIRMSVLTALCTCQ